MSLHICVSGLFPLGYLPLVNKIGSHICASDGLQNLIESSFCLC